MTQEKYIDFHTHTNFSDGVSTPEYLAKVAALNGLDIIAITDHDKIEGYERCKKEGQKWGLIVLPGVEISTSRYHILGIRIDTRNKRLRAFLNYSAEAQKKVATARISLLRTKGIPITLEKLVSAFPKSRLGKYNLFWTIFQDEECKRFFRDKGETITYKLYNQCLKDRKGKEIVDKNTSITPEDSINEIHNAGGIAIIAHPFKEIKSIDEMEKLKAAGIDGLEIQPNYNDRNNLFRKYALENNLLITFGSDWHGGLFGRNMLDRTESKENLLYPKLARALSL